MITTSQAVMSLRPGIQWSMSGDDVEGITWHTEGAEPLTIAQVAAEIKRLQKLEADKVKTDAAATAAAVAHAKSLGFTDAMIGVMYPNLITGAQPLVVGRESLNIPAKIDNNVTLDTVET